MDTDLLCKLKNKFFFLEYISVKTQPGKPRDLKVNVTS
jgi:hypothetical protein